MTSTNIKLFILKLFVTALYNNSVWHCSEAFS